MTRLPRISGKDVKKALTKAGFREIHVRGSHHYLEPKEGGKLVTVPIHGSKVLKPKTLKSILAEKKCIASVNSAVKEALEQYAEKIEKEELYRAMSEAAEDPMFVKDLQESMEAFEVSDSEEAGRKDEW